MGSIAATALLRMRLLVVAFALLFCTAAPAAPVTLRVVTPGLHPSAASHAIYFPRLLRLALEKTRNEGPFEIVQIDQQLTSPRQATEIKNNGIINLMWDGSDKQREADLWPVRVSLLRHLHDYRLFLIRAEDQPRFSAIRSLDELRALKAGAGVNWPSTDILRANQLPVVTSIAYEYLFPMLRAKRFDYLPRGVYEAANEARANPEQALAVEQTIFLHYHVPFYFFVSKENAALGKRVERGLRRAIKDGSFQQLFNSIPAFRQAQADIDSGKRRVFELQPL
ncbi:extracellular solute-binding protein, family 3 [Massilia sp. CF038]|nr:extracellular solute-binding protein, family 3 [Massilia sp. CF038]